jgi:hypothetical protein
MLGLAVAVALAVALALAVPDADAVGLADAVGWWWCLPNAESAMLIDPVCTAMTAPIATPAATGTAIAVAIRARCLRCER